MNAVTGFTTHWPDPKNSKDECRGQIQRRQKKALQGRALTSFSSLLEACISTDCLTSLRCFADIKRFQSVGVFCVRLCIKWFDLFQSTLTFVCHGQARTQEVLLYRQAMCPKEVHFQILDIPCDFCRVLPCNCFLFQLWVCTKTSSFLQEPLHRILQRL